MKNYTEDTISSYLKYLDVNNLHGLAMSQKIPINGFKWVEKLSRYNERFIKSYNKNSDIGYFLEVDIDFYQKEKMLINAKNLFVVQKTKKNMLFIYKL